MKKILHLLLLFSAATLSAQKPALDASVYDSWKNITQTIISDDGNWVAYNINPQEGDGWLYIYNTTTGRKDSIARGSGPSFSADSKYIAYRIVPMYSETRLAKKKKLKEDQMPKNNLQIRKLNENEPIDILRVKSFALPLENSYWMAYLLEKRLTEKQENNQNPDSTSTDIKTSSKAEKKPEPKGTEFVIFNPVTGIEYRYQDVTEYAVARDGKSISFIQDIPDTSKTSSFKVTVFDTQKEKSYQVFEGKGSLKKISSDNSGDYTSFIYSGDTSKIKIYDLWLSKSFDNAIKIVDSSDKSMPPGWSVSEYSNITFSDDGTRLYFGTASKPLKEPVDTLLEEEKYKLDIWSWDDDLLQPMQKKQLDRETKRTFQAIYHTDRKVMFQLADSTITSLRINPKAKTDYIIGVSNLKYRKLMSWESDNFSDYFIINVETGVKSMVLEKFPSDVILSPSGKYIIYWDQGQMLYVLMSGNGTILKQISAPGDYPLYDELNDTPSAPSPYGIAGWTEGEDKVLVYDRYDIWSFNIEAKGEPVNITNSFGRKNNLSFRYVRLDSDAEYIQVKNPIYLTAFNIENKEAGFFTVRPFRGEDPLKLVFDKASFPGGITKAKKSDKIIWQKGSFDMYPELYLSDMDFRKVHKLSITNPQQSKYNWIRAELVEWISYDNQKLQGILYKPENFDPSVKYPMIVYFYERSSDGLYSYYPPAPSASIINRSFAVSNGYLLFVPDIPYKTGYPGQSCYDAVVSGTYALTERYSFIDIEKLGLDGQSWGGYQIAWLVTRTDLFKCAYAGAPVSNMISAYGGIRWESGMSRMFQYEHTQSRIGGTLWDKPLLFIENSPIFFVPRINTPLLIMHNDADGAVPWYQGIELITALRRLEKPAWLLSYNDEAHNLVKRPNRKDLSIRKMQFFDHYLKGQAMPSWMKYGISQTDKGRKDGYELVEE